ncbi:MAG: tRNA (adenosine(37)-N6)-threonylcarbamoyltransferase complex ATPase subunit type 1 TsaE [Verrucomicrobiae bacterium]|nr:tRNA (adenosine(37)-N6)-threonylcarbamoyltransferase complex ATPase subunit type 1 TsaE [Verrucomicrobiae bacterium]
MDIFISNSELETSQLGFNWGRRAFPGLIFGFIGELGAGKTHLVKGIAKGIGIEQVITSPTFAIVNEYGNSNVKFAHIDLYRLNSVEDISKIGLDEYLNGRYIVAIEWAEKWFGILKKDEPLPFSKPLVYRQVTITAINESARKIEYEDFNA